MNNRHKRLYFFILTSFFICSLFATKDYTKYNETKTKARIIQGNLFSNISMLINNLFNIEYPSNQFSAQLFSQKIKKNNNVVDTNFHIYLLAGQSNMAGRGRIDTISKISNPRILSLNKNNEWVIATDPLHFDKKEAGVGPGISFAQEMLKSCDSTVRIGLIPCAVGGSNIDLWQPGAYDSITKTHPYDDAILRMHIAQSKGVIKGILWHQGEGDSSPEKRKNYLNKLKHLIANFRKESNDNSLPVVLGELGYFSENKILFNKLLHSSDMKIPYTIIVSAEGLNPKSDNLHFDTPSARELGRRYAKKMRLLNDK